MIYWQQIVAKSIRLLILISSSPLYNHINIINLYKLMSYYYLLQAAVGSYSPMQPVYYLPSQFPQSGANLIIINPSYPSQAQQKQNFIVQSNIATNESLQAEGEEKAKTLKKKKVVKKQKDENFGWRNQNKDRNILSNILKAFVNYLLEHNGMQSYVQYLYQRLELQNGVSAFYEFVRLNFPLTKSYISPKQLKSFLKDPSHPETLIMVFKLALVKFLRIDNTLMLLKSTKIKRRSKLEQMKRSRDLIVSLFQQ